MNELYPLKAQDDHDKLVKDKSEVLRNGDDLIQFLHFLKKNLYPHVYTKYGRIHHKLLVYLREGERSNGGVGGFPFPFYISFQSFIHVVTYIVFDKELKNIKQIDEYTSYL